MTKYVQNEQKSNSYIKIIGDCMYLTFLNISNHQLSCHEIQVLSKGLTFIPTPKIVKEDIANSTQQVCRKIKLQEYFRYKTTF